MSLKTSQNSQENTRVGVLSCEYCEIFKNIRSEDQKLNLSENYNIYDKTSEAERYCSNRNSKISGSSWAGYQRLKTEKLFHKLEIAFRINQDLNNEVRILINCRLPIRHGTETTLRRWSSK